jgi:hypothetical protein
MQPFQMNDPSYQPYVQNNGYNNGYVQPQYSPQPMYNNYQQSPNSPSQIVPSVVDMNANNYGGMSQYIDQNRTEMAQWASRVIHASESKVGYSASNMCGENNVYPTYGNNKKAYCPKKEKGISRIDVGFAIPVTLNRIEVFETFNPGSIVEISAKSRHDKWIGLYRGQNQQGFNQVSSTSLYTHIRVSSFLPLSLHLHHLLIPFVLLWNIMWHLKSMLYVSMVFQHLMRK